MAETIDINRMKVVMSCYDKLPPELREWVSELYFSLHDDHILRGAKEVAGCKEFIESGGVPHFIKGNGQN
jgi:hypothetical protein